MELDLRSYVMGFLAGRGGSIHSSLLFRELDRAGFNEYVYKTTILEMIDERLVRRKGTDIEKYS